MALFEEYSLEELPGFSELVTISKVDPEKGIKIYVREESSEMYRVIFCQINNGSCDIVVNQHVRRDQIKDFWYVLFGANIDRVPQIRSTDKYQKYLFVEQNCREMVEFAFEKVSRRIGQFQIIQSNSFFPLFEMARIDDNVITTKKGSIIFKFHLNYNSLEKIETFTMAKSARFKN